MGGGYYWHIVGGGQGFCPEWCPITKTDPVLNVSTADVEKRGPREVSRHKVLPVPRPGGERGLGLCKLEVVYWQLREVEQEGRRGHWAVLSAGTYPEADGSPMCKMGLLGGLNKTGRKMVHWLAVPKKAGL